jgi:hypothetical protein
LRDERRYLLISLRGRTQVIMLMNMVNMERLEILQTAESLAREQGPGASSEEQRRLRATK